MQDDVLLKPTCEFTETINSVHICSRLLSKLVSLFRMYSFVEMLRDKCQKELLIKDPVTYTKLLLNNTPFRLLPIC